MDGYVTIGTELDTKQFDKQIEYVENKMEEIATVLESEKVSPTMDASEIKKMEAEYEKLGNQLTQLKKKKRDLEDTGTSGIIDMLKGAGKELDKNVKKVSRWALAIFGIRGAYSMVRQAMSTISQYDEQLATNIEYIKYALANTLKPIIETLVNLAYKLLVYINMISLAWFGVNLFANSSAKSFENAKKELGGATKNAKELKKQLAGFDEMNVLSDTSGGGANAGGGISPSFDLNGIDAEPPKWLKWIMDNRDGILATLIGIAGGILAIKLGLDGIMALGIGLIIAGVILLIQDVIKFLKDPTWNKFADILNDLALIIVGIGVVLISLGAITAGVIAAIIALVLVVVSTVIKNWDTIKATLITVATWIKTNVIDKVVGFFQLFWTAIVDGFKNAVELIKFTFSSIVSFFQNLIKSINKLFEIIGVTAGNVIASAFKGVVNGVLGAIENILNSPIRTINTLIKTINKVPGINLNTLGTFSLPRLAKGGIVNMPSSGVMVGSAIAGERGAEGVIPLTDSQQMALLGEAIGKYITINANITNTMNGRVISRELQRVQNSNDFAFNR